MEEVVSAHGSSAGYTADRNAADCPGFPAETVSSTPAVEQHAHLHPYLAYRASGLYTYVLQARRKQAIKTRHNIIKVRALGTLEQYWRKVAVSINKAFRQQAGPQPRLEELEREILAFTIENQTLAGKLERIRADSERRRSEELQKIETLEQTHRQTETARIADAKRLTELEQLLVEVETGRKLERDQVTALEAFLAETTSRLETRDNQLKFLQDSAREQHQTLKTALAEASSRLETRDNKLKHLQDSTHEQIVALETPLAEISNRFEATDSKIGDLRARIVKQAQQLEASLSSTTAQLEATNRQVKALEGKLKVEHRLQQNMFQDTQTQLHKQGERLNWAIVTAVFTLVLVAVVGAILFWGVR